MPTLQDLKQQLLRLVDGLADCFLLPLAVSSGRSSFLYIVRLSPAVLILRGCTLARKRTSDFFVFNVDAGALTFKCAA